MNITRQGQETLDASSIAGVALCSGMPMQVAWTGKDHHIHLGQMKSGKSMFDKSELTDSSNLGPAVVTANGVLYVLFADQDKSRLVLLWSLDQGRTFAPGNRVALDAYAPLGAAMVYVDEKLVVAWTGADKRVYLTTSRDGRLWADKVDAGVNSSSAPFLGHIDGAFYLAFADADRSDCISILKSTDGVAFDGRVTVKDTTRYAPALALNADKRLVLAWTGGGSEARLKMMAASNGGGSFADLKVFQETCQGGPSLAFMGDQLMVLWTGTDRQNSINVARVVI